MIPTTRNVKTITDLRERTLELLNQVQKSTKPIYIFNRSKPQAVILNITRFKELVEELEDLRDSLELEEAIGTSTGEFTDLEKYLEERFGKKYVQNYHREAGQKKTRQARR